MQEKLSQWKSSEILIKDFNSEFQLFAISISRVEHGQKELKLYYSSEIHSIENIYVTYINGEVIEIEGKQPPNKGFAIAGVPCFVSAEPRCKVEVQFSE